MSRFVSRRRRRVEIALFCALTTIVACGSMWDHLLGPLHEGPYRIQPTTAADVQRGRDVLACLQAWARANGHPLADYSDVHPESLVIVRVGGDGVIGRSNGTTFQTDERQDGDTLFINEGVSGSEFIALEYHGFGHFPQASHKELVGADGDIHWPPPWNACHVPRVIFGS